MARRITDITKDVAIINKELVRLDKHQADILALRQRLGILEKHTQQIRDTRGTPSLNNLVFTWTGATLSLSWAVGYVQDSSLKNYSIPAGSKVVVASTVYWVAWNPHQQSLVVNLSLATLLTGVGTGDANISAGNNLIICSLKTGTAGQTGVAGGGGSDPGGTGPSGKSYVNF